MRGDPGSAHDRVEPGVHPRSPVSRRRFVRHLLSLGRQLPGIKAYAPRNPPFRAIRRRECSVADSEEQGGREPGCVVTFDEHANTLRMESGLHPCENFGGMTDDRFSRRQVLAGGLGAAAAFGISKSKLLGATARLGGGDVPAPAVPGAPLALTVDGLVSPIGLGLSDVAFAWRVNDLRRGAVQSAYRIVVTRPDGSQALGQRSGAVRAPRVRRVRRPAAAPDTVYGWRVQTWDGSGQPSPWSSATFETGLGDADWQAAWIRRPASHDLEPDEYTYARKRVRAWLVADRAGPRLCVGRPAVRAVRQRHAGREGAGVLASPTRSTTRRSTSRRLLRPGAPNAVGLVSSWQGPTKGHPAGKPGVIAQISVLHRRRPPRVVVTDGSWRVRKGAWLRRDPTRPRGRPGRLHREHRRARASRSAGTRRASTTAPGRRRRCSGRPASRRGRTWSRCARASSRSPSRRCRSRRLASGAVVADFGKVYAAVPTVTFHHGVAGGSSRCAPATCSTSPSPGQPFSACPARCRRPRHPAHRHELQRTCSAAASRSSIPSTISGSATSRSTTPARR